MSDAFECAMDDALDLILEAVLGGKHHRVVGVDDILEASQLLK